MGKIVIPKNSASLEEVMGAIQIYYDTGDWLSNADFIQTYKNRIGIIGDDTDSSAYTKKTEIGCYYGFLEWEDITRKQSPRRITPRGRSFLEHYNAKDKDAVFEDIMRSLEEVTFGRNNFACQSCDSDIEPPALFLRAMLDLGYLTNTEFAFLVYRMEYEGYHYTETIDEIRRLRENEEKIELPDEAKKFSDPKPIVIMERWGVLTSVEKGRSISKEFLEKYKNRLKNLKIYNIDMNIGVIAERPPKEVFTPEWFKEKAKDYPYFDVEANAYREKFLKKYSIKKLDALSGIEILTTIFLNNKTTDNLCCELEYNKDCKEIFGSIRSGYSTKYGLYYSKKKASWVSGPSSKQEFISEADAITKGTELRDYLIAGAKELMAWSDFSTEEDYSRLYETLKNTTGGNVDRIWFLKYYQMLRPEVLPTIYSDAALWRALSVLSLTANESSISKMGQIKLFVDKCEISNVLFGKILWDHYPSGEEDHSTEVIEDPEENEQQFRKWMATQVSVNGRPCSPGMISNNCGALKKVCQLMEIAEYPEVDNIFQITDIDTFIDIKEIIKGHQDYEEVNRACNNRFLNTGLKWYEKYLNEIFAKNRLREEPDDNIDTYSKKDFLEKVFLTDQEYDKLYRLLMYKKNIILQGAPGVGKTFLAKRLAYSIIGAKDNRFTEVIQFHQSYSYEDFIMGYKPTDEIFELKTGIFYNFCKKAEKDPEHKHFFIIDEINRGNLSKIFGELLMLIECDKRGPNNRIKLAYRDEKFFVPENIYILGMMNTADRSLAMMDYALRRRFSFFDIEPAFEKDKFKQYLKENVVNDDSIISKIIDRFKALNAKIADEDNSGLGKGFCIGHSYFCIPPVEGQTTVEWYNAIIEYEVAPLLDEYWWDDKSKSEDCKKELLKD